MITDVADVICFTIRTLLHVVSAVFQLAPLIWQVTFPRSTTNMSIMSQARTGAWHTRLTWIFSDFKTHSYMIEVNKDLSKTRKVVWRVKNTFAVTTYPNSDRANAISPLGSIAHWRQKPADVMCIWRYWISVNNIFKDIGHVTTYPCNRKPHSPLLFSSFGYYRK